MESSLQKLQQLNLNTPFQNEDDFDIERFRFLTKLGIPEYYLRLDRTCRKLVSDYLHWYQPDVIISSDQEHRVIYDIFQHYPAKFVVIPIQDIASGKLPKLNFLQQKVFCYINVVSVETGVRFSDEQLARLYSSIKAQTLIKAVDMVHSLLLDPHDYRQYDVIFANCHGLCKGLDISFLVSHQFIPVGYKATSQLRFFLQYYEILAPRIDYPKFQQWVYSQLPHSEIMSAETPRVFFFNSPYSNKDEFNQRFLDWIDLYNRERHSPQIKNALRIRFQEYLVDPRAVEHSLQSYRSIVLNKNEVISGLKMSTILQPIYQQELQWKPLAEDPLSDTYQSLLSVSDQAEIKYSAKSSDYKVLVRDQGTYYRVYNLERKELNYSLFEITYREIVAEVYTQLGFPWQVTQKGNYLIETYQEQKLLPDFSTFYSQYLPVLKEIELKLGLTQLTYGVQQKFPEVARVGLVHLAKYKVEDYVQVGDYIFCLDTDEMALVFYDKDGGILSAPYVDLKFSLGDRYYALYPYSIQLALGHDLDPIDYFRQYINWTLQDRSSEHDTRDSDDKSSRALELLQTIYTQMENLGRATN